MTRSERNPITPSMILLPVEIIRRPRTGDRDKAHDLLTSVGLNGFDTSASWQLSGGMRQRVSLCRALIRDPEILLLDEPFAALDAFTREDLWKVLEKLRLKTRCTMVLITHQLNEAVFLSDRILVLSRRPGRIVYEEGITAPLPRPVNYAYTPEFTLHVDAIRRRIEH